MMGLLQLTTLWRPSERLAEIARQIAERSQPEVSQRVSGGTAGMSAPERRGYIRARSAAVIHREVDRAMLQQPILRAADRPALLQLATDAVITAVACKTPPARRRRVA
jgi:hypothetical protein